MEIDGFEAFATEQPRPCGCWCEFLRVFYCYEAAVVAIGGCQPGGGLLVWQTLTVLSKCHEMTV